MHRSITKLNYENLIKGLLAIENQLKDRGPYFFGPFTHVDINLMCCFQRLMDVRLGEVLKIDELTNITKTRFIIITHHALTMSRMHRLYGITMPEKGVSQLVTVDLQKAEELVA